jgi:hypothetical protein
MDKTTISEGIAFNTGTDDKPARKFWMGIVKVRELPHGCTQKDYAEWWPILTEKERERYTAAENQNVLTLGGFAQLLTYIGSGGATTLGFAQFFSVGTFPIQTVQAGDTGVNGEIYRVAPTSATITGNQLVISSYFGPSNGNGNLTNAGLYGVNATSSLGTGQLMTHTLYSYVKANGQAVSNDYIVILN